MATHTDAKYSQRIHRHKRVRARISGTAERPRLAIYKSNTRLSAQLIDDVARVTLAATSTAAHKGKPAERIVAAAKDLASKAQAKGVSQVVFDRGGFQYIGIIKAFADAVREAGLTF